MIKLIRISWVLFAIVAFLPGCNTGLHIEKSYSLQSNPNRIRKMVFLMPEYQKLVKDDGKFIVDSNSKFLENQLAGIVMRQSKTAGQKLTLMNWETTEDKSYYYNTLFRLHEQIMAVNFSQLDIVSKKLDSRQAFLLPHPVRILPEFSYLSDSFGTPYVLCSGVVSKTGSGASFTVEAPYSMFYFFVVDIQSAEVLYRTQKFSMEPIKRSQMKRLIHKSIQEMQTR
ncbi:MAG: hypothetical protein WD077_14920 [Bacteroidia bacterium]